MTCTFFGHRNTYRDIQPTLASTIIDLIETKQVDTFYYGNHGNFDRMVHTELKKLKAQYPHIRRNVQDRVDLNLTGFSFDLCVLDVFAFVAHNSPGEFKVNI